MVTIASEEPIRIEIHMPGRFNRDQLRLRHDALDPDVFEIRRRHEHADISWCSAQMECEGRRGTAAHEPFEFDEHGTAALARFAVAHGASHAGEPEQRGQHEKKEDADPDALKEPFPLLKIQVFVDLEGAGLPAHLNLALIHRSNGSAISTSKPKAQPAKTSGQAARLEAMPSADASQMEAAVVRP